MKLLISIYIIYIIALCSCSVGTGSTDSKELSSDSEFEMISSGIKDSLITLKNTGLIPISISKVTAVELEDNNTLEWILNNGTIQDFEELLYNHPNAGLKAIGVKGLIKKKDKDLFKHLLFAFDQDVNIQYSFICQKLGGYFLYQLDYSVSDSTCLYFSKDEIKKINEILKIRYFGCT